MGSQLFALIDEEERRQADTLSLIASENIVSDQVRRASGSVLTNKYSESLPGARYYGGNQVIDKIERLAQTRALSYTISTRKSDPSTSSHTVEARQTLQCTRRS